MKTLRSPSRLLALISAGIILLASWPERQVAVLASGHAQTYPAVIQAVNPIPPDCLLRHSPNLAERLLELSGTGFSTTQHNLQFRHLGSADLSIHFHGEVTWESSSRITLDIAGITDLLWADSKLALSVRLTTYTGSAYVPVSDWSPAFYLADDAAACSAPLPFPIPDDDHFVDIYVLNFNPLIDGVPLTEYDLVVPPGEDDYKNPWNEPDDLTPVYIADVLESSGGAVTHRIARQSVIRAYPVKPGGFVFTNAQYMLCLEKEHKREPIPQYCQNLIDYATVLNTRYDPGYVSACEAIATQDVDEIWLWGGPWFGYREFNFIQPDTLCNGVTQRFTVMGFSPERGVAEMLEDLGHRAEVVLLAELGETLWDRFDGQRYRYSFQDNACPASPDPAHPEVDPNNAHCGNVHFAPNSYCAYIYNRNFPVQSDCDDWLNYPQLTGAKTTINAPDTWASDKREYFKWWLAHFPRRPWVNNGLYNNWWNYIFLIPRTTFVDVPPDHWAYDYIELFYQAGYTAGCRTDPLYYCPDRPLTRAEMAVFLVRAIHGRYFVPPPVTVSSFEDVPPDHWAIEWIEQLYRDGFTAGCNADPLRYCPDDPTTRAHMAVFLERLKHGASYVPLPVTQSSFEDVPADHWAVEWIEALWQDHITAGCWADPLRYCPERSVTRAEMAVFLVRALDLLPPNSDVAFVIERGPIYPIYLPVIQKQHRGV